jgi:N-acetyl-anhydromuramyl-L-alanine amidase AmpD
MKLGFTVAAAAVGGLTAVAVFLVRKMTFKPNRVVKLSELNCDDRYKATKHGPNPRDTSRLRLIVIHSTEGSTAAGAAGWFANPSSQGSAHIVVDDDNCFRTLPDNMIPWGAKGGNSNQDGLHIELAGFAKRSRAEWLAHPQLLQKAADVIAYWCHEYNIPLRFLDAEDLKAAGNNARGITTHAMLKDAFKQDSHWDPGPGFPIDVLMDLAGADYKENPYV